MYIKQAVINFNDDFITGSLSNKIFQYRIYPKQFNITIIVIDRMSGTLKTEYNFMKRRERSRTRNRELNSTFLFGIEIYTIYTNLSFYIRYQTK